MIVIGLVFSVIFQEVFRFLIYLLLDKTDSLSLEETQVTRKWIQISLAVPNLQRTGQTEPLFMMNSLLSRWFVLKQTRRWRKVSASIASQTQSSESLQGGIHRTCVTISMHTTRISLQGLKVFSSYIKINILSGLYFKPNKMRLMQLGLVLSSLLEEHQLLTSSVLNQWKQNKAGKGKNRYLQMISPFLYKLVDFDFILMLLLAKCIVILSKV